jgi:DNA polymerase-3 subunit beta
MKISIEKNVIFKSLSHVQSIVEKKNTIPILSNILLEASNSASLILTATDMDISIKETINCSVIESGSVTVPAHTLYDIIKKIPDGNEIEFISNDGSKFSIRSGKSKFSLSCLPKEDFPLIEFDKFNTEFSINSQVLLNLIEKTRFAISNEETRYFLNGIYFHKKNINNLDYLCFVATDGHRLAKITFQYQNGLIDIPGVIIPKKTVNELCKLLAGYSEDITINLDPSKIIFYIGKIVLVSKLIDGNFPDYQRVIPKNNNNILNVNKNTFCEAVDRVSTITSEKSRAIKFKLLNNLINMTSSDAENGSASEDILAEYDGEEIEIGFNSKYILEMINQLDEEKVTLKFNDTSSPVIATEPSNPDLLYVLMPMRV